MRTLINKLRFFFYKLSIVMKGGDEEMAWVYVTLIVAGERNFYDIPKNKVLREKVRKGLLDIDMGELIIEEPPAK